VNRTLMPYRTHPDRADENQRPIKDVSTELDRLQPTGLGYVALCLRSNVTIVGSFRLVGE
jgi:hypothetical protein